MNETDQAKNPRSPSFRETLDAAQSGDSVALDQLFREFYPDVQKMVHDSMAKGLRRRRPWLASCFSTGDVVQEVFRSVLRDVKAFTGSKDDFRGYLAMIVRNRLVDAIRFHEAARRDGRRVTQPQEMMDPADPRGNDIQTDRAAEAFLLEVAKLDEREQLLLRERIDHGATFQALADRLGYASAGIARRAFYTLQAQLIANLRSEYGE